MKNSPKVEEARREAHECCPFTRDPYDGQTCEMPDGPMLTRCEELHDAIDKQANLIAVVQADCNKDASGPHPPEAEQSQVCVNPSVHPQPCQVCGPQEMIRCRCGHETWTQPQVGHGGTLENAITAASFILDKQEVVRLRHAIQLVRRCKPGNANPMLTESKLALMLAEARLEVLRKIVDIEVGKDRFHAIKDIEYLFLEARAEVGRLKNAKV